jgi:hypothetical protein
MEALARIGCGEQELDAHRGSPLRWLLWPPQNGVTERERITFGDWHGQPERPQHQKAAEMQELRGKRFAEEGRQGGEVPEV